MVTRRFWALAFSGAVAGHRPIRAHPLMAMRLPDTPLLIRLGGQRHRRDPGELHVQLCGSRLPWWTDHVQTGLVEPGNHQATPDRVLAPAAFSWALELVEGDAVPAC